MIVGRPKNASRNEVFAYLNACPHRGTPLDLAADHFFDAGGDHLVCATHGAMFRPADGVCVAGPCRGARLKTLALECDESGMIWLLWP